jgi:hypothetical protein
MFKIVLLIVLLLHFAGVLFRNRIAVELPADDENF